MDLRPEVAADQMVPVRVPAAAHPRLQVEPQDRTDQGQPGRVPDHPDQGGQGLDRRDLARTGRLVRDRTDQPDRDPIGRRGQVLLSPTSLRSLDLEGQQGLDPGHVRVLVHVQGPDTLKGLDRRGRRRRRNLEVRGVRVRRLPRARNPDRGLVRGHDRGQGHVRLPARRSSGARWQIRTPTSARRRPKMIPSELCHLRS